MAKNKEPRSAKNGIANGIAKEKTARKNDAAASVIATPAIAEIDPMKKKTSPRKTSKIGNGAAIGVASGVASKIAKASNKAATKSTKTSQTVSKRPTLSNLSQSSMEEAIRLRAYEIYLRRGGRPGNPHEDWALAEREIRQYLLQNTSAQA
jgi:hypothetical protein